MTCQNDIHLHPPTGCPSRVKQWARRKECPWHRSSSDGDMYQTHLQPRRCPSGGQLTDRTNRGIINSQVMRLAKD
jgi:hypothetical protein